jgi:uncharacterized protein (DUF2147 family)
MKRSCVVALIGGMCAVAAASCPAFAAPSPIGVWIDHTGRGGVEITDCGGKLCGRLVWFKDNKHARDGCNFQIIGNVRSVGGNRWDGGWIVDPDKDPNKKYDVEITPLSDQKLRVMGYAGMKFLSETMVWTRAPADLKKCGEEIATPAAEPSETPSEASQPSSAAPAPKTMSEPAAEKPAAEKPAAREATRKKSKDCKVSYAGYTVPVPCGVLQ